MLELTRTPRYLVERILCAEDYLTEAGSEVIQLDVGRVVRQPAFPHVFDVNLVLHPQLDASDLDAALCRLEEPLRDVGALHTQIAIRHGECSERTQWGLRLRGFMRDRLLTMALLGPLQREQTGGIEVYAVPDEAPFAWFAELIDELNREEPWYTESLSREIVGSLEAKAEAGVLVPHVAVCHGRPVGAAGLGIASYSDHLGVASITTVGTAPWARLRGVAQALVVALSHKAQSRGCDLVYLLTRADDTPHEMYRKIGFETVTSLDFWLRLP